METIERKQSKIPYPLQLSASGLTKKKVLADNSLNLNRDNFSHFVLPSTAWLWLGICWVSPTLKRKVCLSWDKIIWAEQLRMKTWPVVLQNFLELAEPRARAPCGAQKMVEQGRMHFIEHKTWSKYNWYQCSACRGRAVGVLTLHTHCNLLLTVCNFASQFAWMISMHIKFLFHGGNCTLPC